MAQSPRPPRPYAPVAITRPAASDDASFVAFRAALAAAAKSRLYAELAPLVLEQGFFWGRDFGQRFDPRKPAGGQSRRRDRAGARQRRRLGCARGFADGDRSRAAGLPPRRDLRAGASGLRRHRFRQAARRHRRRAASTGPIRARTKRRCAPRPQPGAAKIGTLGLHFVRLLGFEGPDSEPAPGRTQWARVALPDGKTGFVAPGSLMSLTAERLCYIKDLVGGWRIAGYIAGGN